MKSIEVKNNTYIDSIKEVNDEDPKFNPQSAQCLLKTLKKCKQLLCTGLLHSSKIEHLDHKN